MRTHTNEAHPRKFRQFAVVAAVAIALVGLSAGASQAAMSVKTATVALDFPFTVNGTTLPAGSYQVKADEHHVILRSNAAQGVAVLLPVVARVGEPAPEQPRMVFEKVDGEYRLSQILLPGVDGFQLPMTGRQEAAGRWAANR